MAWDSIDCAARVRGPLILWDEVASTGCFGHPCIICFVRKALGSSLSQNMEDTDVQDSNLVTLHGRDAWSVLVRGGQSISVTKRYVNKCLGLRREEKLNFGLYAGH